MNDNDIIYGAPLAPHVTEVVSSDEYKLFLTFDNGEKRVFDAKPLLSMKVFAPLKNKGFFKTVKVEYGTIAWANDIDYCPDTLYNESVPVN